LAGGGRGKAALFKAETNDASEHKSTALGFQPRRARRRSLNKGKVYLTRKRGAKAFYAVRKGGNDTSKIETYVGIKAAQEGVHD